MKIGFSNFTIYEGGHIKWIENHSKIEKIINRLHKDLVKIGNKFNRRRLFNKRD